MKIRNAVLLTTFVFPSLVTAAGLNLVELDLSPGKVMTFPKSQISILTKLRLAEESKDYKLCSQAAEKAFSAVPEVQGWVLYHWLRCAQAFDLKAKKTQALLKPLAVARKHPELFTVLALNQDLSNQWMLGLATALDNLQANYQDVQWTGLASELSAKVDKIEKDRKGSLVAQVHKWIEQKTDSEASGSVVKKDETLADPDELPQGTDPNHGPEVQNAEFQLTRALTELISSSKDSADPRPTLKECIQFLQTYPSAMKAKVASDKILEILQKTSGAKKELLIRPSELPSLFSGTDPVRLLDWSKALFKSARYESAMALAKLSAERFKQGWLNSGALSQSLFIYGKSAQLSGKYQAAVTGFGRMLEMGAGSEDAPEALLRQALCYYRLKRYSETVQSLNSLLNPWGTGRLLKGGDKLEVQGRYWLIRALQKLSASVPEAQAQLSTELAGYLRKYPWTYYGLRLQLEQNSNKLAATIWKSDHASLVKSVNLTAEQNKIWRRVELMAQSGFTPEASRELANFLWPQTPEVKIAVAERLAKLGIFPQSFKLVNEATENRIDLVDLKRLQFTFPSPYTNDVQSLGAKYGLSPILINSLIRQESAFGIRALSTSNALGLMQLIPPTASDEVQELNLKNVNIPEDIYLPSINLNLGTHYISKMIHQFKSCVPCGLAAYNAGPVRVDLFLNARTDLQNFIEHPSSDPDEEIWFDELPWAETSYYVKAILRNSILYRTLAQSEWTAGPVLWSDLVVSH
jgi:soluble lytic murein transglycosylase